MLRTKIEIEEEAIGWVMRLKAGDEHAWYAFTRWLGADPAHAAAYEEIALCDDEAEEVFAPAPARPRELPLHRPAVHASPVERRAGRRAFLRWGIAASLVFVTGYAATRDTRSYSIETEAGERREIELADGSRIELNGDTKVTLDKDRPRFARLEQGEALFHVIHAPASPFEVEAGDAMLRDMGTIFNVVRQDGLLDIAVSEGAVLYNPGREATNLQAGMALRREKGAEPWIGKIDTAAIGTWSENRLIYTGMPMSRIASDLQRNLGVAVSVDADVANRPFSGIIMIDGDRAAVLNRTAALLGLKLGRDERGWTLKAGAGEAS
ncbi:MAG: FecR domain-containing protein [Sphingosinicella sp.]|nr:FecR domain-containing protein [Sphingosinicella sp.]